MSRGLRWQSRVVLVGTGGGSDHVVLDGLAAHAQSVRLISMPDLRSGQARPAEAADLVLGYGPHQGSLLPAARYASTLPGPRRPVFAWWVAENLPSPRIPTGLVRPLAWARARAGLALDRQGCQTFSSRAHRLRILGELHLLRRQRQLDLLPVAGERRAAYLRRQGFDAFPVFFGGHPFFGRDLSLPRDIDVLFVGQLFSSRRRRIVRRLQDQLASRGIVLEIVDGRTRSVDGAQRIRLLNRSKILLNILKSPYDGVPFRFLLGATNKTLVISEPMSETAGFVPGRHFAMGPVEQIPDLVSHYIIHAAERRALCEAAHLLVTQQLTIERSAGEILRAARVLADDSRTTSRYRPARKPRA